MTVLTYTDRLQWVGFSGTEMGVCTPGCEKDRFVREAG